MGAAEIESQTYTIVSSGGLIDSRADVSVSEDGFEITVAMDKKSATLTKTGGNSVASFSVSVRVYFPDVSQEIDDKTVTMSGTADRPNYGINDEFIGYITLSTEPPPAIAKFTAGSWEYSIDGDFPETDVNHSLMRFSWGPNGNSGIVKTAPNSRITFNVSFIDRDSKRLKFSTDPWQRFSGKGPYKTSFSVTGTGFSYVDSDGMELEDGPPPRDGLESGNFYIRVNENWPQVQEIAARIQCEDKAPNPEPYPNSGTTHDTFVPYFPWRVVHAAYWPKSGRIVSGQMTEPVTGQGAITKNFIHQALPGTLGTPTNPPAGEEPAYFTGVGVDEVFTNVTPTFDGLAISPEWRAADPIRANLTALDIAKNYLFTNANTSFGIEGEGYGFKDVWFDPFYIGFSAAALEVFTPQALLNGIGFTVTQQYKCGAEDLGTYTVEVGYKNGVMSLYRH